MTSLTFVVLLETSLFTASPAPPANPLRYQEAYRQTAQTGQPLLVLVGAQWCAACERMKASVMPELNRRGRLHQVTYAMVDQDSEQKLAARLMSGATVPQLILFTKTSDGWTRRQLTGMHSSREVQAFLHNAIERTAARPQEKVRR